jgi:glutathione peroxidase
MQALYDRHASKGFEVLAFPCNQFGSQEPGSPADIRSLAGKYGVTFPVFEKVDVNGAATHSVFSFLKNEQKGFFHDIKWNFAKFLVDRDGQVIERYLPTTSPDSIEGDIIKALGVPAKCSKTEL